MKSLFFSAAMAFILVSCTSKSPDTAKPSPQTDAKSGPGAIIADVKSTVSSAAVATQTLEIGCAKCTYSLPGVAGCAAAVKVGGKAYAVSVPGFDSHKEGLCKGAKQAKVTGELQGDKFVASAIEILK